MAEVSRLALRVQDSAQSLQKILNEKTNAPVSEYVDTTGLQSIADILTSDFTKLNQQDFDSILLVREGIYDLRQAMRDANDDGEHSVDVILNHIDRLYVDLERALLSLEEPEVASAQARLRSLQQGKQVPARALGAGMNQLAEEATEVLVTSHITQRNIEINLINLRNSNINIEAFKNAKLKVQRLSASVFSIRLSLKQSVVFEGIFKFLHDNADRILDDLRQFVSSIKETYSNFGSMLKDVNRLIEVGGRFTRLVGEFINNLFDDSDRKERQIGFEIQSFASSTALSAGYVADRQIRIGGRQGKLIDITMPNGFVFEHKQQPRIDILSMLELDDKRYVVGTPDGIELRSVDGESRYSSNYKERVVAMVDMPWGGAERALVTGSKDGQLRRWSFSGGLNQYKEGFQEKVFTKSFKKGIQSIIKSGNEILLASGFDVYALNEELEVKARVPTQIKINCMVRLDANTIMACGDGGITQVKLSDGPYSRLFPSSSNNDYSAIAKLNNDTVCVCDTNGNLTAIEVSSGIELGSIALGFRSRGLLVNGSHLAAFGGEWGHAGKAIAILKWRETFAY